MTRTHSPYTELRRELDERTADLKRVKAEYDNYRKRVRRDRMAVREIATANVLRQLLPVLDAVDRACRHEAMTPGLRDIVDTLRTQLGALGIAAFGEPGDAFDPTLHEAITHHIEQDAPPSDVRRGPVPRIPPGRADAAPGPCHGQRSASASGRHHGRRGVRRDRSVRPWTT